MTYEESLLLDLGDRVEVGERRVPAILVEILRQLERHNGRTYVRFAVEFIAGGRRDFLLPAELHVNVLDRLASASRDGMVQQ